MIADTKRKTNQGGGGDDGDGYNEYKGWVMIIFLGLRNKRFLRWS